MYSLDSNCGILTNYEVLQHLTNNKLQQRYPTFNKLSEIKSSIQYKRNQRIKHNDKSNIHLPKLQLNNNNSSYINHPGNLLSSTEQQQLILQYKLQYCNSIEHICWLKDNTIQYLQQLPAYTQNNNAIQQFINNVLEYSKKHNIIFTIYEINTLINMQPNNDLLLKYIIDELYDRIQGEDKINELIDTINNSLPQPPVFKPIDLIDINNDDNQHQQQEQNNINNDTTKNVSNGMTQQQQQQQQIDTYNKLQQIAQYDNLSSESSSHKADELGTVKQEYNSNGNGVTHTIPPLSASTTTTNPALPQPAKRKR